MYSEEQLFGLYNFLLHTGEANLKKMLVEHKFTEGHLRLLLKIVKTCDQHKFASHLLNNNFPTIKFNALEMSLRDRFWPTCCEIFETRGLLTCHPKAAA